MLFDFHLDSDGMVEYENYHGEVVTPEDGQPPLMQFTGLQDKNGKEIYEGDLIRVWNGSDGPMITSVIWSTENYGYRLLRLDGDTWHLWQWDSDNDEPGIEVIGNIHENPELLETK